MMAKAQPDEFRLDEGYHYKRYFHKVDSSRVAVTDVFGPEYWVNATDLLPPGTLVRVQAVDKSYDFEITVIGKAKEGRGLTVDVWPRYPAGMMHTDLQKACEIARTILKASKVAGKPVPRVEPNGKDGWRVIDISGQVASVGHVTEADANVAMAHYMSQLGIKTIVEPEAKVEAPAPAKAAPKAKAA